MKMRRRQGAVDRDRPPHAGALLVAIAVIVSAACGESPTSPEVQHDLSGRWRGFAQIPTTALETPLEMTLVDEGGRISGTGGGVDCRVFLTCGSFYAYVVTGTREDASVRLNGETPEGRRWLLTGTIDRSGAVMSGVVNASEFPASPFRMTKVP